MTDLEKVISWLYLCPYLQTDAMYLDTTQDWPISAGLYPQGLEVLKATRDVTGERTWQLRQNYLLRCAMLEGREAADRLQQIQNWIFTQNINGITPGLGSNESVRGTDGRLEKASQVGKSIYVIGLTVEYEKKSEGV